MLLALIIANINHYPIIYNFRAKTYVVFKKAK